MRHDGHRLAVANSQDLLDSGDIARQQNQGSGATVQAPKIADKGGYGVRSLEPTARADRGFELG
jgi:hypothetical protein